MLYSSPTLKENYIQSNSTGIFCSSGSQPVIGNKSTRVGNYISSNNNGIIVYNNAIPIIGNGSSGGYNNLVNSTYNVLNTTGNTIYAQKNWWNNDLKISGLVSYSPDTTQITINAPPLSKYNGSFMISGDDDIPMLSELDKAYQLVASNNLSEAREVCLNLINNYPDYSVSYNALNLLKDTYTDKEITAKNDVYKYMFTNNDKKDLYGMAGLILSDIDKDNRLKHIDAVIETYKGESIIELALFDKLVYYCFELNDKESARTISKKLDEKFPESMGAIEAHKILGDEEYYKININDKQVSQNTDNEVASELLLSDNYPNPFNPTTSISYTLPEDGKVQVKIFDVLGRELATIISGFESKGKHSIVWDGSNVSSGVYFYSITFKNQAINKKMLMIK